MSDLAERLRVLALIGEYGNTVEEAANELDRLRAELERERIRLAACGVVAMANTEESAKTQRQIRDDYRSDSLNCVIRAVDEEMKLRAENAALRQDAERYRKIKASKWLSYTTDFDAGGKYGKGDTVDVILIEIPCAFEEPRWTPEGHFDYALELDAAIDAAREEGK